MDKLKDIPRSDAQNAQVIYNTWKHDALDKCKECDWLVIPIIQSKIKEMEKMLHKINNSRDIPEVECTAASAKVTQELQTLEHQRHQNSCTQTAVHNRIEGETICQYWTQVNKAAKPRDMIHALKPLPEENAQANPPPPPPLPQNVAMLEPPAEPDIQYVKESEKMAELARNYHDRVQSKGVIVDPDVHHQKIAQVLDEISKTTSDEQKQSLGASVTRDEVLEALLRSQSNTAAGLDGATYKFWKTLHNRFIEDTRLERPAFDVIRLMTAAFEDIQNHGVVESTRFSEGWMCPLYKKGEHTEIENYRPITCLNTDYKVFTKMMASKLAK